MYAKGGRGAQSGGRGYGGGGRGGYSGDARFRGFGNRGRDDGGGAGPGRGKGFGKGKGGGKGFDNGGGGNFFGKGGKGDAGNRSGGGRGGGGAVYDPRPLGERNAEVDRIDAVFGYDKIDADSGGAIERVGWCTNMRTVVLEAEGEGGAQRAAVEYYFLAPDGTGFKVNQPADAYFYIAVAHGHEAEVDHALRRKFAAQITDIKYAAKEDLAMPNHLSGLQKTYLQLTFKNTRDLMDVRKVVLPAVQRNRLQRDTSSAYAAELTSTSADAAGAFSVGGLAASSGDGAGGTEGENSWLDRIEDIREYDVQYHHRIAIDTGRRVGLWYNVKEEGGDRPATITRCETRKAFGEPRVLAFDIECVKQPLKFPDANVDPVMMISYMMDGVGFLIINRETVSEDIEDFEYNPKPDFPGPFQVFNELSEEATLKRFCSHLRELQPHVIVTYNGDSFDWPYIDKRCEKNGMSLKSEVGFAPSNGDNGAYYVSTCTTHIDCIHWVKRDSYLPAGSHGLKAVCRAKLGYDPLEIDPEQMTRFAIEQPQLMSSYSVSDAVATYYLYMKYVHGFIFSLSTVIPMSPDEVLRKGSGTLCESLLMVEAFNANVICPNKQVDDLSAQHDGQLLESETYVGGHVECLQTGVYRNDIPVDFRMKPAALQTLIDRLDETLEYHIREEGGGVKKEELGNYDEVRQQIADALAGLRDNPTQSANPIIYHLDVGAMYPNIILTNRLQPPAVVSEQTCASCVHNKPESDCKRPLEWMWRGEVFPSSMNESASLRSQLEYESFPNPKDPTGPPISFLELEPQEQNSKFRARLKEYCQKVYKKTHVTKMEKKVATTCQRENPFYIDTVRAFRDRRYEYKKLNKTWGKKKSQAEAAGDGAALLEAKAMCVLYDSLQLAHKCILNSFYGYVMRKGARWYSMEMAGVVTYTGAAIIKEARTLVEDIGKTLELDTDGIWCVFPGSFPQDYTFKSADGSKKVPFSYPCVMLNVDVDRNNHNPQYQVLNKETGEYEKQREQSIYFEVDGPYKAMILPASTEEGKLLKKRYAVFEEDGTLAELKGFEIKRRGELKLIKVFQTEVFGDKAEGKKSPFLDGTDLRSCYESVAAVADRWVDVLESRGVAWEDDELLELVSEQKSMSKSLDDYGAQKSTAITVARRLAEFLGDQMVKDAGLACKFIIANRPQEAAVTDRAIPVAIFESEEAVKVHYLRRWLKDRSLSADDIDIRAIIDWGYYRTRLDNAIQKIITIPAALQKLDNPVPRVAHPDWLKKQVARQDDTFKQKDVKDMFKAAVERGDKVVDVEELMAAGMATSVKTNKRPTVHSRKRIKGLAGEDELGSSGMSVLGGSGATDGSGAAAGAAGEAMDVTGDDADATAASNAGEEPEFGTSAWLKMSQRRWRAIRQEKRRLRREQEEEENGNNAGVAGVVARAKRPVLGQGLASRTGLGAFVTDAAATLHGGHWQIITLQPTPTPGEMTAWVLLGGASASPSLHPIPIRVPRQLYVNMRAPHEAKGWVKVTRALPRGAPAYFMYEVGMDESDFLSSASDMAKWMHHADVHAVYHTHLSPHLRLLTQLGCTCHVARGAPRRSPHDGFGMHELRPSSHQDKYLQSLTSEADAAAAAAAAAAASSASNTAAGRLKKLLIYATGTASRGVLAVHTPHDGGGVLLLVRPRGSALSPDARVALASHPTRQAVSEMHIEAVDSWDAAHGRLQRLLPTMQAAAKGPMLALCQTKYGTSELQALVPTLLQLPCVRVPHNRSDGAIFDDGGLQLGGAWQPHAVEIALDRCAELVPYFDEQLEIARLASVPVGCLPTDAYRFACDVLMHRRLLQAAHLSWLSPSPLPDLGGHPAIATDGSGAEEERSPEVSVPGMYRTLCVEIQLDNLCVNTIVKGRLSEREGIENLSKDLVASAASGAAADEPADDAAAFAPTYRILKAMVQSWLDTVHSWHDPNSGVDERTRGMYDQLLLTVHRWLASPSSLLHDPSLYRNVQLLMKKMWLQLLADVRSLGAKIVYASFTKITIATDKASLRDGLAYVDFLLNSLAKKPVYKYLHMSPKKIWSSLLFLDAQNHGGIQQQVAGLDGVPEDFVPPDDVYDDEREGGGEGSADGAPDDDAAAAQFQSQARLALSGDRRTCFTAGEWNMGMHLPPAVQVPFKKLVDLYIAEPWMRAAVEAARDRREAPSLEEVQAHAVAFFDQYFAMAVIENVHEVRSKVPSTGEDEQNAVRDGTASAQVVHTTFPLLPGSHLKLTDPALEFTKAVCHLASLEPAVEAQLLRLRRNVLRQLNVREFALEGVWKNPSLSFLLTEVQCDFCGHCRDLDVCRDGNWGCSECGNMYDTEALETRLLELLKRRSLAYQLQDVQCAKCRQVQVKNLAPFCNKCAGPFALRVTRESFLAGLRTFANIASFHEMPLLAETADFLARSS